MKSPKKQLIILKIGIFAFLSIYLMSCSSSSEKVDSATEIKLSPTDQKIKDAWDELSPTSQKILGSFVGIIRDKNWGDSIDKISENLEKSESQPENGISYSLYFDDTDLNFVDISYLGQSGKLNQIIFDVYLEEPSEVKKIKEEVARFLTNQYGSFEQKDSEFIWDKNQKTRIKFTDMSTAKDPGLKLEFIEKP
ncbi:hypothetical protein EOJ36_06205 [Sandaracinomonas limnophila]|uniref:Uncharacterized protein n=1 Tax=Sandaracinomonas limnophila TaxID=1862386 RepID=A0A437PQT6_9BACT|nr:hypothetical protein [Sandaracinomonas limnophila]RVU24600.1 hypothetical protein EOJ36_06205 [Sandaracinomonas limnophila]